MPPQFEADADGTLPHWADYAGKTKVHDFKLVIPSFDRPQQLCGSTLRYLREQQVDLSKVTVFVSPQNAINNPEPEWFRYTSTLRREGFGDVNVRPGGVGLENQLIASMEWARSGYLIVMTDLVKGVSTKVKNEQGRDVLVPLPIGSLPDLWEHAFDLMKSQGAHTWSCNPSHRADFLRIDVVSRMLGFLDGNMMGMLIPENWREFKVHQHHGMIYHVELTAAMWHHGYRSVRYMGLCVNHPFRNSGGQSSLFKSPCQRRKFENQALKEVAALYPDCLRFDPKPDKSLKTMQYKFLRKGKGPLTMRRAIGGRKRQYFKVRASTSAERMRALRGRNVRAMNGGRD